MKNKKPVYKYGVIGIIALLVAAAVFAAVYLNFGDKAEAGLKTIKIEIVNKDNVTTEYETKTEAEFLRQALEETEGLVIEGEEQQYGLYIKTINGETADYDTDGAYWALYTNGEYAQNGVDSEIVKDGDTFMLKYEK